MPEETQKRWRIGTHFGIHVYQGDTPIATFHHADDALTAVRAYNEFIDRQSEIHRACWLCGHLPTDHENGLMGGAAGLIPLCHTDDHSCYEDWTIRGLRDVPLRLK